MFSSNLTARFFDHHFLWEEAIAILDFLLADSHYRIVVTKTVTSGWVWSGVSGHAQTCLDLLE